MNGFMVFVHTHSYQSSENKLINNNKFSHHNNYICLLYMTNIVFLGKTHCIVL
jgi:hypothetical protein